MLAFQIPTKQQACDCLPEDANVGLVPDIPHQSRVHVVFQDVAHELVDEVVVVGPVPIVSRPYRRRVGVICAPDVVGQQNELGPILAARTVVRQRREEAPIVLGQAIDPAPIRRLQLSAAGPAVLEVDVGVPDPSFSAVCGGLGDQGKGFAPMVGDLVRHVWNAIDKSRGTVSRSTQVFGEVDRRRVGVTGDQGAGEAAGREEES